MGMKSKRKKSVFCMAVCCTLWQSSILRRQKIEMGGAEDTKICQDKGKLKNR